MVEWVERSSKTPVEAVSVLRPAAGRHPRRGRGRACGARPRRLHRAAAAAQQDPPTRGRSSTPCAACCPTSSWPATAGRPRDTDAADRRGGGRQADRLAPRRGARPAPRRPLERQLPLGPGPSPSTSSTPRPTAATARLDLAMLHLFGLTHLPRVMAAYDEAQPLAEGWEDRLGIHQLFPLLVHACMFGGGYGARAGSAQPATPEPGPPPSSALAVVVAAELRTRRSGSPQELVASLACGESRPRVLVVDDDRAVRDSLRRSLEFNGYDGRAGRRRRRGPRTRRDAATRRHGARRDDAAARRPRDDAALRAAGNDVPILVLTARDAVGDRVDGPRRRRRRLPGQAVRAGGAAGPGAGAAAPQSSPTATAGPTTCSPSPTCAWTSRPAR